MLVYFYISQDYGHAYCHRTIEEVVWLPFQKRIKNALGKTSMKRTKNTVYPPLIFFSKKKRATNKSETHNHPAHSYHNLKLGILLTPDIIVIK